MFIDRHTFNPNIPLWDSQWSKERLACVEGFEDFEQMAG
jgi:hypothetical protein